MEPSDEELLRTLRDDPAALDAFYRRHVSKVMGYASRRCRSPEEVADLVAATFVGLIDSAHRFDPLRGTAVGYLLGIANRQQARLRRGSARERKALARLQGRRLLEPDDYARLEEQIDAGRRLAEAELAISTLPQRQRDVLELVAYHGLSVQDAAHALRITPATARMRLARARRVMRQQPARPPLVQEGPT